MTCWEARGRLGTRALRLRLAPGRGDPFSASAGGLLPSLSLSSSAAGGLRLRSGAVRLGTGGLGASDFGASPSCADMRLATRADEGIDAFRADIAIHYLYLPLIVFAGDVGTSAEAAKGAAMAAASGDLGCGIALTEAGSSCSAQVKLSIQVLDSPNQQHS